MAKYRQTPADWYRAYIEQENLERTRAGEALAEGNERGAVRFADEANETDKQRKRDEGYFRESIKLLRKYVKGFTAADGYDLNKLIFIPQDRLARIRKYAPIIRRQTGQETDKERGYKLFRPRSRRSDTAIRTFTGQTDIPRRTAFIVFTDKPDKTQIKTVTRKHVVIDKRGRKHKVAKTSVRITEDFKGGRTESDYFLFADYGEPNFVLFEDMKATIKTMLPHMPKGWYVFTSSEYGRIAAPMRKEQILSELEQQWMQYDVIDPRGRRDNRGLAQTITGFKLIASTLDGAQREYNARLSRAEKAARWRSQRKAIDRRKAESRLNYSPTHPFKPFADPRKARYCRLCGLTKDRHQ